FFFFQAEDGIRDFHVTGVQTCALPISAALVADGVIGFAGGAQQFAFDVVQEQLAALAAINGGVHATADAGGIRVDDEQADALLVAHVTGGAGGNQDLAGGVTADDYGLATAQAPAAAVLAGGGLHVEQVVVAARLFQGHGGLQLAAGDGAQQLFLLLVTAQLA